MNALAINPLVLVTGALAAIAIGFGSGWTANGWRLHAEISEAKATRSGEIAKQSQAALDDLTTAAKKINDAAGGAQADISTLGAKLDLIRKEFKNAKPAPLPADCRMDDVRLRNLREAAGAVNEAALGLKSSRTLQTAPSP